MSLSKRKHQYRFLLSNQNYFVWLLVLGSLLSLLVMGAMLPQDIRNLSTVEKDKTGWTLSQVEAGFYQLSATVLRESGQASLNSDLIRLRTEIVLSRLELLKTKKNRELLSTHRDAADWYQMIENFKDKSIQIIDQAGPLNREDINELDILITLTLPKIRELSVAGFVVATEQEAKSRIDVTRKIMRFGLLAIALLISLAISLLYLARLLARAKEKDSQLRTLTTRLSATLEASLDGVVIADKVGRIIDYNEAAARVFGWTQKEILGKLVNETISPSLGKYSTWNASLYHLRFPKVRIFSDHRFESLAKRKSGELFPAEVTVTALNDPTGEIYLIAFKDISDLKIYEQEAIESRNEAERTNHAKTQFLRAMSHEMRTPLSVILGSLELLRIEQLSKRQATYVNSAASSSDMLLALVNDALDITRIETGDISLNPENFSLLDVCNCVVDMIRPLACKKGLTVSIEFAGDVDHTYFADKLRISQIITNLLGNAVKYTDTGSIKMIVSGVRKKNGLATRIHVTDTGPGIPIDQHKKIFEYFVTSATIQSERQLRSDGLGLPLSKKIAKLLGGNILIESNAGTGSTFILELFLDFAKVDTFAVPEICTENPSSMSILIVEDTVQTAQLLKDFLVYLTHCVDDARDGIEGLKKAQSNHYDLIIMDVNMPLLDGLETTRCIRSNSGPNRDTYILGLTAHTPADVQEKLLDAGMNSVRAKPIRLANLQEILKNSEISGNDRCIIS